MESGRAISGSHLDPLAGGGGGGGGASSQPHEEVQDLLAEEALIEIRNAEDEDVREALEDAVESNAAKSEKIVKAPATKKAPAWVVWGVCIGTVVFGVGSSMCGKWQNMYYGPTCDGCSSEYFAAPFTQSFQMFIGEHLCLYPWLFAKYVLKRQSSQDPTKKKCKPYWWTIAAACDLTASGCLNFASTITLASTVQVLRNFLTLLTAALTLVWLRRPLRVYEWVGVFVLTLGMIICAMYSILNPEVDTNWDPSLSWLGIVLALVGTCVNAFQIVYEEFLLKSRRCSPMEAVGWEGTSGLVLAAILLFILQATGGEDVKAAIYMTGQSSQELWATITYIMFSFSFNATGLAVSQVVSGLLRTFLFSLRSFFVWILELLVGWNTYDSMDLAGQLVSLLGIMIFAGALVFPCWPDFNTMWRRKVGCGSCLPLDMSEPGDELKEAEDEGAPLAEREPSHVKSANSIASSRTSISRGQEV